MQEPARTDESARVEMAPDQPPAPAPAGPSTTATRPAPPAAPAETPTPAPQDQAPAYPAAAFTEMRDDRHVQIARRVSDVLGETVTPWDIAGALRYAGQPDTLTVDQAADAVRAFRAAAPAR